MSENESGAAGENKAPTISNADVKSHPLFKKLTQELSDERKKQKEIQERLEALEADETKRKTKAAEKKEDYEKAKAELVKQAKANAKKEWDAEQAVRDKIADAKLHLVKAGFKNEKFIRGALEDFNPDEHTADGFAKALAEDEANKPFLGSSKAGGGNPDPHPAASGGKIALTPAEIQALRASSDPKDIEKANQAAEALWVANGGTTGLPT